MTLYDDSYVGLTGYNEFGYNVFGIHKSWYYLYGQPIGIKIPDVEHQKMQALVFGGKAPFDPQRRETTKLTHMIDPYGYDPTTGLHILGYGENGYDIFGYNKKGYNKEGYNKVGYSKYGAHKLGYDEKGFDINGLTKSWHTMDGVRFKLYAPHGYREGYDIFGFDEYGYDKDGYNMSGYNTLGINRDGRFIGENF